MLHIIPRLYRCRLPLHGTTSLTDSPFTAVRRTITSKSNASTNSSLSLRRVLILSKQTRYETEVSGLERATSSPRAQATDPTKKNTSKKQELEREISRRGLNFDRLHQSYDSHVRALETIEKDLERHNIEYQVVTATRSGLSDFPEAYQNYDAKNWG